jgi:hypothetical protein
MALQLLRAETADRGDWSRARKEYKDDGHTGTLLDRPALNQLRADLKADLFDTVYFLAHDSH